MSRLRTRQRHEPSASVTRFSTRHSADTLIAKVTKCRSVAPGALFTSLRGSAGAVGWGGSPYFFLGVHPLWLLVQKGVKRGSWLWNRVRRKKGAMNILVRLRRGGSMYGRRVYVVHSLMLSYSKGLLVSISPRRVHVHVYCIIHTYIKMFFPSLQFCFFFSSVYGEFS